MSDKREFNASTVEESLQKASSTLGIERSSISYEVLDEGSSGFLGLGARDARILVSATGAREALAEPQSTAPTTEPQEDTNQEDRAEEPVAPVLTEPQKPAEPAIASEELLARIKTQVEETLSALGFDGVVSVVEAEEAIEVAIDSSDAGLLIGQKGETLDAMQYLVNVSSYRNMPYAKKILLDAGGYRERRVKAVQGMALRAAKRVLKESQAVDLPPMTASERRAVHTYLRDDPRVSTSSSGDDETRRVTISPA